MAKKNKQLSGKADKAKSNSLQTISENRKARHRFAVLETLECGIVLLGSEVKTESANAISIKDGPSAIDLRGVTANLTNLYHDLCAKYETLLKAYQYNNTLVGQAVLGPYSPGSMVVNSSQTDYRGNVFD